MELSKDQENLYKKAFNSLLYDDIYDFVLSLWPDEIDTSKKIYINYDYMKGTIEGLQKYEHDYLEDYEIGNLLIHLDYALKIVVHRCGLCLNIVRPKEIDRLYVKYWFEDKTIGYAVTDNIEDIPQGFRENLDSMFDMELVKEYFNRNRNSE